MTQRRQTSTGRAPSQAEIDINPFRAQHLSLAEVPAGLPESGIGARFDAEESPLLWLARRKDASGRALIAPHELMAGERLRSEFTAAQMMPRTTANWHSPVAGRRRSGGIGGGNPTEHAIAARQRTRQALTAVGPDLAGLLIDVCCFLKRLDEVERDRGWPARSGKVALRLALAQLARHYGYAAQTSGRAQAMILAWQSLEPAPAPLDGGDGRTGV